MPIILECDSNNAAFSLPGARDPTHDPIVFQPVYKILHYCSSILYEGEGQLL